ncbi:MAG: amino acid adenylation domain-containing protein [Bacteroidota bacterium]
MDSSKPKSNLDKWLALKKKGQQTNKPKGIGKRPTSPTAPLSYGQQRLWLLQQLYPESPFYNYAHLYHFRGKLDQHQLQQSLVATAQRHQMASTVFRQEENGEAVQFQQSDRDLPYMYLDWSELDNTSQTKQLSTVYEAQRQHLFDLEQDALIRVTLIRLGTEEHLLVLLLHHIIGDRSSLGIFNRELAEDYRAQIQGKAIAPNSLKLEYADYAYWQQQQKISEQSLSYWTERLTAPRSVLELPSDFPRPAEPSFSGQTLRRKLPATLSKQLKTLAKEQQTTLFVVGLALYQVMLYRYSGQEDLLIGAPFSTRDRSELTGIVGFFNETLVLRTALSPKDDFLTLLTQVKQHTLDALNHKDVPFDRLVQELKPERQGSSNPLFQAMFVMNEPAEKLDFGTDLQLEDRVLDLGVAKFDLTLFLSDTNDGLEIALEYASDLFEKATVERMLGHLEVVAGAIVAQPQQSIATLPLLSAEESTQLLETWNSSTAPLPTAKSILSFFTTHAQQKPEHTAVQFGTNRLSYIELAERANAVAHRLQQQMGAELRNKIVGLYTEPSVELLVGILGILKAGAAYLPLDPAYPEHRITYMLEDAQVDAVVTTTGLAKQFPVQSVSLVILDEEQQAIAPEVQYQGSDLAYMIYTSGSTGKPKGVPINHANLVHSTAARFHFYEEQPGTFLLLSSFSFDSSVAGIFWSISSGGTLVLAPRRIEQDMDALTALIHDRQVTHTLLLPSLYGILLELAPAQQLSSLEAVMVAGEACSVQLASKHFDLLPQTALYNEYGPTEGTVWSTAHQIKLKDLERAVPIGRPIPYTTNYILDQHQQLLPAGVHGELYIGGSGVAQGYWQRPELTASRFINNPFGEGQLYRTGDRVRYRPDGIIEFLGRVDQQLKIRGHRVEPGEIERTLLAVPAVQEVVVLVNESMQLLAWVQAAADFDLSIARQWLRRQLPAYMMPSKIWRVDDFPRLPNGKLNRNAILETATYEESPQEDTATSELEEQLLDIWRSVINLPSLGVNDNFFDVGGDSLRSIRVIAQARKAGIALAPNLLFEYPTVRELAYYLTDDKEHATTWESISTLQQGEGTPPLFCLHSGAAHVFFYRNLAKYLGSQQAVYALQPKGLDGQQANHNSIEEMAAYYLQEIKRIQPEGPYTLLGTCFSNAVGLEMAHQLLADGDSIAHLIFVDSGPAHLQSLRQKEGKRTMRRFGTMLKQGDWKAIRKKVRNRLIVTSRKISQPFKSAEAQSLQTTINNLNNLYANYNWKPVPTTIHFIRSTEFASRPDKDYHIEQWSKLAGKTLEVAVVDGHHLTLFEEPEVQGLAQAVGEILVS